MPISRDQYSRKATRDVKSAMAQALARHLEGLEFFNPSRFQFAAVFDEWPSYLDRYVPPSACVLPTSAKYADALFTPTLLEDTWEVKGEAGFGLYKLAEMDVDMEVSIRCAHVSERDAVMLGVEQSFVFPELLMSEAFGPRYGIMLPLPDYYGLCARFALSASRVIDDEDHAIREQRDAVFTVSAQASVVRVGPVYPLNLKIQIMTDVDVSIDVVAP
jgi:hypothetical protein